jgi:hypothetical protein
MYRQEDRQGVCSTLKALCIDGRITRVCRKLGRWEFLEGLCIAGSIAGGCVKPEMCECLEVAGYSQEDCRRMYEAREVGVRWRGSV